MVETGRGLNVRSITEWLVSRGFAKSQLNRAKRDSVVVSPQLCSGKSSSTRRCDLATNVNLSNQLGLFLASIEMFPPSVADSPSTEQMIVRR